MRHIPEDELHAYLDQALSRSQCVEIERHLARCPRCQSERDDIAALRDRTTALLARIGPPPIVPPAFETLQAAARLRPLRRSRWVASGAWAASIAAALLLGWQVNVRLHGNADQGEGHGLAAMTGSPDRPRQEVIASAPAPVVERPAAAPQAARPKPIRRPQLVRASHPADTQPTTGFAKAIETDPPEFLGATPSEAVAFGTVASSLGGTDLITQPVGTDPGLHGLWRTVVPDSGSAGKSSDVALVPGLPVIQMRVQPGSGGDDVTAVDQLLESGEVIRTISGPAARVLTLVNEDAQGDTLPAPEPPGAGSHMTVTIRQSDRMVAVTGPSQALGSLLARVNIKNAKRRY